MRQALGCLALVLCAIGGRVQAQGAPDSGGDLRLEIAVIAGDARELSDPATPAKHKEGLSERIRSSLGTLAIDARYAAQASGHPDPQLAADIDRLRALFAAGRLAEFARVMRQLAAAHPVYLSYFQPLAATKSRHEAGRSIYRRYCIGCHASQDPDAKNPAPNLFRMAAIVPREELIARLLTGIHGDGMTSLENPFTDEAIASLAVYLIDGEPAGASR